VTLAGLGVTAACGAPGAGSGQSAKTLSDAPVNIQLYKRGTLADADVETVLREWKELHPTWNVDVVQGKSAMEQLAPHIAGGDKIDVLGWYQTVRALISSTGIPLALDDFVKRDKYNVGRFGAKELDLVGRYQGKLFALYYAYGGNLTAMFYNRALFKQAGVPEPPGDWNKAWAWDEFRDVLRRLTKRSGTTTQVGITGFGDPITSLLTLSDARWISDDWKKIDVTAPELLQTLENWENVSGKDGSVMSSPNVDLGTTSAETAFLTGKAALYNICCGPAGPAKKFTEAGMDWGFAPDPKMKYASPDFQSNIVLLTKLGAYPDHGWELTKYLIEDNRWGAVEGRVPAFVEDAQTWTRETFKYAPDCRPEVLADSIKFARPVDKIKYHPAGGDANSELYKPINAALAEAWAGRASVRTVLPPLQSQLQAIMERVPMPG
jgi:ABC-type glycerol-3-phosphate transport system substrate-binding protein